MLEFLFNNVGLPVNIAKFLRTSILRNICKQLLLTWGNCITSITGISRYVSFHLKSDIKGALSGQRQFLANESPLKMIKILFILSQKLISFSRYLSCCLDILLMYRNGCIKKIRLISNFMTSQPGQQTYCPIS